MKPSVLDWSDLTACANKQRKVGYWKNGVRFINGLPVTVTEWIIDTSSKGCKHDRKAIESACAMAKCPRIGGGE